MPERIQLRRTPGWRKPVLARIVSRPSYWGNPFVVGQTTPFHWRDPWAEVTVRDRAHAVELLREYLAWRAQQPAGWCSTVGPRFPWEAQIRDVLKGCDLACWCPLDQPCHADVLLDIANGAAVASC